MRCLQSCSEVRTPPVVLNRVKARTFAWLVVFQMFAASSCASYRHDSDSHPARDVANALLLHLFDTFPPKDRIVCVNLFIGAVDTWHRLDSAPTLQYLKTRGISALDGSECAEIPPPTDSAGDWRSVGEIIHSATGRPAANYGVRVVQVDKGYATLHGGFAFSRRHGGSCPYEGNLVGRVWVVRERTTEPCAVM